MQTPTILDHYKYGKQYITVVNTNYVLCYTEYINSENVTSIKFNKVCTRNEIANFKLYTSIFLLDISDEIIDVLENFNNKNCVNCYCVYNCTGCIDCSFCAGCYNCFECYSCESCAFCNCCTGCVKSNDCTYSNYCNNHNKCKMYNHEFSQDDMCDEDYYIVPLSMPEL